MFEVKVNVTLKKTVVDPQGLTVKHALESLGYKGMEEVRVGKLVVLKIEAKDKASLEKDIEQMCRKLLSNPIIEDYTYIISEA